jgi:tRNA pseudouridine65 synthase
MTPIPILYRDDDLIAVHKPAGLLVHRTSLDAHESQFLLQVLRDQIGLHVHPVHRLDKGTSGVVVFALHAEAARRLAGAFATDQVQKSYLAVVRGHAPAQVAVDHPLRDVIDAFSRRRTPQLRPAFTEIRCLARIEIPAPVGRYATARYSVVACRPRSGRRHQIRRHLKHLRHPVIGDANYGDGAHNRFFRDSLGIARLLLAATAIRFPHPIGGNEVQIRAPLDGGFRRALDWPEWQMVGATPFSEAWDTWRSGLVPASPVD